MNTWIHRKAWKFTITLFIISKVWKQAKYSTFTMWINKRHVVYLHNWILLSSKKEWTTDTGKLSESQKHYGKITMSKTCCLILFKWPSRKGKTKRKEKKRKGITMGTENRWVVKKDQRRRSQDGGGVGRGEHFLPHKFIKRAFKRLVNSTKQFLNAGRGHQAPRKATQLFERR